MKNIFYIILFFAFIKSSYSEVMLLNCSSEDSKNFTFYKWQKNKSNMPEVFFRPIKSKWVNFCENHNKKNRVQCDFTNFKVKRTFDQKYGEGKFFSTIADIDFENKKLKITIDDSSKKEKEILNFKCKKVKT